MLLDFPGFIELSLFEEPDKSKNIDLIRTKLYLYKFDQIIDKYVKMKFWVCVAGLDYL